MFCAATNAALGPISLLTDEVVTLVVEEALAFGVVHLGLDPVRVLWIN